MRPVAPVMSIFIAVFVPFGVFAVAGYHVKLRGHRMRLAYQIEGPSREASSLISAPLVPVSQRLCSEVQV